VVVVGKFHHGPVSLGPFLLIRIAVRRWRIFVSPLGYDVLGKIVFHVF